MNEMKFAAVRLFFSFFSFFNFFKNFRKKEVLNESIKVLKWYAASFTLRIIDFSFFLFYFQKGISKIIWFLYIESLL